MSDFYVGQEVVCVDAKPRLYPICPLTEGRHYTIAKVLGDCDGVLISEFTPPAEWGDGFYADRFAPIKESNIHIFREMCRTVKRNIDA